MTGLHPTKAIEAKVRLELQYEANNIKRKYF